LPAEHSASKLSSYLPPTKASHVHGVTSLAHKVSNQAMNNRVVSWLTSYTYCLLVKVCLMLTWSAAGRVLDRLGTLAV